MLFQDVRFALRTLRQHPGFTALAVTCLALGIGVNASIFSVVDGVLLQPYPYPDASRIIVLNSTNLKQKINRAGVSYADFKDWRDQNTTLSAIAAFTGRSLTIADGRSDPERFLGASVSSNLFSLLGTPPALGRDFGPDDDRPGAEPVVLLSDDVWRRRYDADPSVVGRSISINGRAHTVIGVMPPKFMFPENQRLWVTLAPYAEKTTRAERNHQIFARLKPGVTVDQALTDLKGIASRLETAYPTQNEGWSAFIRPLRSWMLPSQVELMILAMMSAATLVLMIACANVANLLPGARLRAPSRDFAARSAGRRTMADRPAAPDRSGDHRSDQRATRNGARKAGALPDRSGHSA